MTNQEKFIQVFGITAWQTLIVFSGLADQFKDYWTSPYDDIDCRDCKKYEDCSCGKSGHESGTSQGYSIGECKDFEYKGGIQLMLYLKKKTDKKVLKRLLKYINKRINAYNSLLTDPDLRSTDEKIRVIAILQELKGIIDIYYKYAEEEEEKEKEEGGYTNE